MKNQRYNKDEKVKLWQMQGLERIEEQKINKYIRQK